MKLITEVLDELQYVTEAKEDGSKNLYIEGVFLQSAIKNRNGRMYPEEVMDKERITLVLATNAKRFSKKFGTFGGNITEISIFSMMRPHVNHGTRDVSAAQTSREAIDVDFSALPAAEPSLRTDLTAPGQRSHCETYFFRVELTCLPRLIPKVVKECVISVGRSDPLSSVQKTIRRALKLPPTTVLDLTYDGLMKGIKVNYTGDLRTFLQWTERTPNHPVTMFVNCDEQQPPAPLKLKSSSKRRRERQKDLEEHLKEERVCQDKTTERPEMRQKVTSSIDDSIKEVPICPVVKKPRKDIENARTTSAVFSATLVHKKWETLRQYIFLR